MKKYSAIEKFRILDVNLSEGSTLSSIASHYQIPLRTLHDWKRKFLSDGLEGLKKSERKDKGLHRALSDELTETVKALALIKPALTIKAIYRKIRNHCKSVQISCPSYSTVYKIVADISPALMTLAHEGAKEYRQKYDLIYRRECDAPNQVWQIDHSLLDILLVESSSKFKKPWLSIVIDDYSRAICGYFLSFEDPCAVNTALCLRQAIWKKGNPSWPICGIPQILYTDHGTDFTSDHIQQVCIALKIRMVNSMVGRPQGRGKIERFFDTINKCVLQELSGYLLRGKPVSKPTLGLTQLSNIIEDFIINQYHHQIHGNINQTPLERWNIGGFLPQIPESLTLLDDLLLSVEKSRKVQRDGIRFHGFRYVSPILAGFVGEVVTIHYDPRDLAEIKTYHGGKFLCGCICQDMAGLVVSLKDIQKARKEVKQGLYDDIKRAKLLVKAVERNLINAEIKKDVRNQNSKAKKNVNLKLYHND